MIRHHCLRGWPGPIRQQIVPWNTVDQVWWHEMLPTGVIGLSLSMLNVLFFLENKYMYVFAYSIILWLWNCAKCSVIGEKDLQCTCVPQSRSIDWPSLGECTEPGNHSHCSDLIIPPPNEVGGGVYWIHLVCPSVRPSVCDDMVSGA